MSGQSGRDAQQFEAGTDSHDGGQSDAHERKSKKRALLINRALSKSLLVDQMELQRKLDERDRQIADLRRQLAAKDRVMETQRAVLEEASQNFTPALRAKVIALQCA